MNYRPLHKNFICFIALLLFAGFISAQPKSKPVPKVASSEIKKLLAGTGLPYNVINDSLAFIPYEGENVASFQVVVQKVSDLYIIYTNLSEALPGKMDETNYKYLLQKNDHFDIVKIGLSAEDSTLYLRADVYKSTVTTALLTRIIKQVANVTNIIGGDLK